MTIQTISPASVVVYLPQDDLSRRGLCAEALTEEQMLDLTRSAFLQAGLPMDGLLELEIYPNQCGLLLFVHMDPESRTVWYFSDSESLLGGVAALGEEVDGALYGWEEGFVLALSGPAACLSEFGTQETGDAYILDRLREHGVVLLENNAPAALREYFKLQKNA